MSENTVQVSTTTIEQATNYAAKIGADVVLSNCTPQRGVQSYDLPTAPMQQGMVGTTYSIGTERIVPWNFYLNDNSFPYIVDYLLNADMDARQILLQKAKYLLGLGEITLYKNGQKVILPNIHPIAIWLRTNRRKLRTFNLNNALNYVTYRNFFNEFILARNGTVYDFKSHKPHNIRSQEISDQGIIEKYFIYPYTTISTVGIDPIQIMGFTETRFASDGKYRDAKFMYHGGLIAPEDQYQRPEWLGGTSQLDLRRKILDYYNSSLTNGLDVPFILIFHQKFYEIEGAKTPEDRKALKQEKVNQINEFLTGAANAGKTLAVDGIYDRVGKEYKALVEILPVDKTKDTTKYNTILERSDTSTPANFGIPSMLAGIERAGALSKGTELIQQHNKYVMVNVPSDREEILEPINLIFQLNGWDITYADLYDTIGFEDVLLESSNKNEINVQ